MCFEDDLKAFELLFKSLNPRLIKFCIYYVKHKEAAEEIVSDVFVKCWESRQNLKIIANPETYLFVAVKNLSFNYLKKYSNILMFIEIYYQILILSIFALLLF